jgi:hypothetical protein
MFRLILSSPVFFMRILISVWKCSLNKAFEPMMDIPYGLEAITLKPLSDNCLIACFTTKAGATEVWNAQELDFLMEIGEVARGNRQAYLANPCFVTAKETISPLILSEEAGEVLLLLAQRGLPTTVIPMPLTGGSSPISLASNVALCNAEVLGVATALRCACPL